MINAIQLTLFVLLLLLATTTDIKKREIPDVACIGIGMLSLFDFHIFGILAVIPCLVCGMMNDKNMGGGDIKFVAAVGLFLGFWNVICGLIIGLTLTAIVSLINCKGIKMQGAQMVPLAPFLSLGFLMAYFIF